MRPDRRWWIFILAMAMAWGGRWWLAGRRPGPVADRPAGEVTPDPALAAPALSGPDGSDVRPDSPISTAATDATAHPDDGRPPGPPEPADGPDAPDTVSGLEKLSVAEGPGPHGGESSGSDRLPGVDVQLELATAVDVSPAVDSDIRRGERAQQAGKLAEAERDFLAAVGKPGANPAEGRQKLAEVYWLEGRFDEVRTLAREIWRAADRAGAHREAQAMLEFHLALGLNPLPIDRMQAALDRAVEKAPQDDRVWLGRGYLALRDGRLAEAQSWLDACRRRRPDDPAVWRARLEWAIVADREAEAREALPHVRADDLSPARVHELRAWFAARRGDAEAERQALEQAVAADPGETAALERLAELATRAGRREDAARLRRRKAELDVAMHHYRTLFREHDPVRSTARMAGLAETLGRRFEAIGLWTLVRELAPADAGARAALERLGPAEPAREESGRTLAERLPADITRAADADAPGAPTSSTPPRRPARGLK